MNKITIEEWNYTCADGCCYNYGIDVTVNGETIRCQDTNYDTVVKTVLDQLGIEAEVNETYSNDDEE